MSRLGRVVCLDTETTGVGPDDEVLSVGLVDAASGRTLFGTYVRPERHTEWPGAMRVNHITPDMVSGAPSRRDVVREVQAIVDGADAVVAYNMPFDRRFVERMGVEVPPRKWEDAMMPAALVLDLGWDDRHKHPRWPHLDQAAAAAGHDWGMETAHGAEADARALSSVWRMLRAATDAPVADGGTPETKMRHVGHGGVDVVEWTGPAKAQSCGALTRASVWSMDLAGSFSATIRREWSVDGGRTWQDCGYGHVAAGPADALAWLRQEGLVAPDEMPVLSGVTSEPETPSLGMEDAQLPSCEEVAR